MKAIWYPVKATTIRFISFGALLSFLCAAAVSQEKSAGQKPTPARESPAVLKVTTRLITVDVVARDHHGDAVKDLKSGDFQIVEQAGSHKSQEQIASFRLLDRALAKAPNSHRRKLPARQRPSARRLFRNLHPQPAPSARLTGRPGSAASACD